MSIRLRGNSTDDDYVEFTCERCGDRVTRLRQDHDGFNVCRECRWYDERPWIKRVGALSLESGSDPFLLGVVSTIWQRYAKWAANWRRNNRKAA